MIRLFKATRGKNHSKKIISIYKIRNTEKFKIQINIQNKKMEKYEVKNTICVAQLTKINS